MLSFIPLNPADASAEGCAAHAPASSQAPSSQIKSTASCVLLSAVALGASLLGSVEAIAIPTIERNPVYVVRSGDTIESIANRYGLTVAAVEAVNTESLSATMSQGEEVVLPWVPSVMVHPDFSTGADRGWRQSALQMPPSDFDDTLKWPVTGSISSRYGWRWGRMHRGLDIQGPVGTPIEAALDGIVSFAGWDRGGYGYRVDISHPNGMSTLYAHGQQILVNVGDRVSRGQPIMTRGSTGRSTGPHLHFEIRRNGVALDPESLLSNTGPIATESNPHDASTRGVGGAAVNQ